MGLTGTCRLLRKLAHGLAQRVPEWVRASAAPARLYRWSAMLSASAQKVYAATLLRLPLAGKIATDAAISA